MNINIKNKGFISLFVLAIVSLIVVSATATGVVLYKNKQSNPSANISEVVEQIVANNTSESSEVILEGEESDSNNNSSNNDYVAISDPVSAPNSGSTVNVDNNIEDNDTKPELIIKVKPEPDPVNDKKIKEDREEEIAINTEETCNKLDDWYLAEKDTCDCENNSGKCPCDIMEYQDYRLSDNKCIYTVEHYDIIKYDPIIPQNIVLSINNINFEDNARIAPVGEDGVCWLMIEPLEVIWETNIFSYSEIALVHKDSRCQGIGAQNKKLDSSSGFSKKHRALIQNLCFCGHYVNFSIEARGEKQENDFIAEDMKNGNITILDNGSVSFRIYK